MVSGNGTSASFDSIEATNFCQRNSNCRILRKIFWFAKIPLYRFAWTWIAISVVRSACVCARYYCTTTTFIVQCQYLSTDKCTSDFIELCVAKRISASKVSKKVKCTSSLWVALRNLFSIHALSVSGFFFLFVCYLFIEFVRYTWHWTWSIVSKDCTNELTAMLMIRPICNALFHACQLSI